MTIDGEVGVLIDEISRLFASYRRYKVPYDRREAPATIIPAKLAA